MFMDDYEDQVKKEESMFLSLCSKEDRKKLTREIPLSFMEYVRIICILSHTDFVFYEMYLNEQFPEYCRRREEIQKRHEEILEKYSDYYEDECFEEKVNIWLKEFCAQISDKEQQRIYKDRWNLIC